MNPNKLKLFFLPVLVIAVFFFSFLGFHETLNDEFSFWGALYATIASFLMEETDPTVTNQNLIIAKFLAAILVGYGAFTLIYKYAIEAIKVAKVRLTYNNHVIVFSLDLIARNTAFELLKKGYKVVIIEPKADHPFLEAIQRAGAIVIKENPAEQKTLEKAGISSARICIVANEKDETNIEQAKNITIFDFKKSHEKNLKILVHVKNWDNINLLKDYFDIYNENEHYDLDTFNVYQAAAQKIYDNFGPHQFIQKFEEENAIAIVGCNEVTESFIIENIILSHYPGLKNLKIYLIDKDVEQFYNAFNYKFPFYTEFIDIIPVKLLNGSFFANFGWSKENIEKISKVKAAYFFGESDAALLNLTASFRQFLYIQTLQISHTPLILCLPEDTNILNLFDENHKENSIGNTLKNDLNIHSVKLVTDTCTSERLIEHNEKTDTLSYIVNYFYSIKYEFEYLLAEKFNYKNGKELSAELEQKMLDFIPSEKQSLEAMILNNISQKTNISVQSLAKHFSVLARWNILSDRKKDSNRYVARHLNVKLAFLEKIGCYPINNENIYRFFPRLAPIEHKRWSSEKMVFNFKFGPFPENKKDKKLLKDILKIHDQLIPYDKLDDENKEKDLNMFLLIPLMNAVIAKTKES